MAMGANSTVRDAEKAALAFKAVAVAWLSITEDAANLAGGVSALQILYLSAVWHATGDFSSAAVAGLLSTGVEYHHVSQRLTPNQQKRRKNSRQKPS